MMNQTKPRRLEATQAIQKLGERLGQDAISDKAEILDRYGRTALPSAPRPIAIVYPRSKQDVVACLEVALEYRLPVYPISGGKNWGLGSACPTTEGQIVIDLAGLNRIIEVNEELGFAIIEPGVTQGQLFEYIRNRNLNVWMDATGAGPNATIIGNLMERGYGHSPTGDRFHNSCAFEVVLPDGTTIETGWAHNRESQVSNLFKTGLGPSIDGLFTQSNLGVVTRATIWLIPRPECFEAYAFRLKSEQELMAAIDALRPLRALGVINSVVHMANDYRIISSHGRFPYDRFSGEEALPESVREEFRRSRGIDRWNILGGIYGTRDSVAGTKKAIRKSLKGIARPIFISDKRLEIFDRAYRIGRRFPGMKRMKSTVESARSAIALLKGEPVGDHLGGGGWRTKLPCPDHAADPLERGDGFIWLTPLIPLTGSACHEFLSLIEPIFESFGFEPLLTFVMISGRVMCCPTTICYDKTNELECIRAQACYEEILITCMKNGFPPYRAGIQTMQKLANSQDAYWSMINKLKETLDPHRILAPGRYCPE